LCSTAISLVKASCWQRVLHACTQGKRDARHQSCQKLPSQHNVRGLLKFAASSVLTPTTHTGCRAQDCLKGTPRRIHTCASVDLFLDFAVSAEMRRVMQSRDPRSDLECTDGLSLSISIRGMPHSISVGGMPHSIRIPNTQLPSRGNVAIGMVDSCGALCICRAMHLCICRASPTAIRHAR